VVLPTRCRILSDFAAAQAALGRFVRAPIAGTLSDQEPQASRPGQIEKPFGNDAMLKRWIAGALFSVLAAGMPVTSALAFTVTDSAGKVHRLADYKGKWVLVNFWATWCPPCLEEIPDLVALHENKKNKLVVIGVAMDYRDPKAVLQFADQQMISYPVVLGDYNMAAQIGPVRGLPTSYLYNPQGKVVAYTVGTLSRAAVEDYIARKK
jgi:thiol-disulfide isomerase/thioredoxin